MNGELHELATDLIDLATKLDRPLRDEGSPDAMREGEQRLQELYKACSRIAADMITRLG